MSDNCNCIEHFSCGFEAGKKYQEPEIRLTERQLADRSEGLESFRFEGHYDLIIYCPPFTPTVKEPSRWGRYSTHMWILDVLEFRCGATIESVNIHFDVEGLESERCIIGLREC